MERRAHENRFENQIKIIESKHIHVLEKSREIISQCRMNLLELRRKVVDQGFLNENDEVHFFKFTKQVPLVYLLHYLEVQEFEANFPLDDIKGQKKYIKAKTRELNEFFRAHTDFVKYVRLQQTHFDKQFFTRKYADEYCGKNRLLLILDPIFNTTHDRTLAKIKAFQKFSTYLQNRLTGFDKNTEPSILQWTSTKVSLTELVYALYYSRAINNGNVDIKQIAAVFEKAFNFNLGNFYRTYIEIRGRKKDRLKFLDELSYTLSNSMKQDDA